MTRWCRRLMMWSRRLDNIKHVVGLRQFLLRGLKKVKLEWLWACLANNAWKLVRDIRSLRAQQ